MTSERLLLFLLLPFLELLPEPLQQSRVFTLPEELGLLEPLIQELQLLGIVGVVIICDSRLVILLWDYLISKK